MIEKKKKYLKPIAFTPKAIGSLVRILLRQRLAGAKKQKYQSPRLKKYMTFKFKLPPQRQKTPKRATSINNIIYSLMPDKKEKKRNNRYTSRMKRKNKKREKKTKFARKNKKKSKFTSKFTRKPGFIKRNYHMLFPTWG